MGVKDLDRTNPEIDGSGSGWTALGLNFLGLLYFPSVKIQKCELASKLEGEKMTGFIFGLCRLEGPNEGPAIVCASVRVCVFLSVPWKAPCFCLVSSEQDPRDGARAGCCPLSPSPWEAGNVGPIIQPPHPMAQASGLGRGGGAGSFGLRFCSGCRPKVRALQEKSVGVGVFGGDRKGFHLGIIKAIQ